MKPAKKPDAPVICGPFAVQDQGAIYTVYGTPLPWPGPRRETVPKVDATVVATVVVGDDGSYRHYPRAVARAHAILLGTSFELADLLDEAESFITGFEGDETQEGVDNLLARIRLVQKRLGR